MSLAVPAEVSPLLNWGIVICLTMALVWAARIKRRGTGALPMMFAFLVFAVGLFLFRERAPEWSLAVSGAVLFALLVIDALMRSAAVKEPD